MAYPTHAASARNLTCKLAAAQIKNDSSMKGKARSKHISPNTSGITNPLTSLLQADLGLCFPAHLVRDMLQGNPVETKVRGGVENVKSRSDNSIHFHCGKSEKWQRAPRSACGLFSRDAPKWCFSLAPKPGPLKKDTPGRPISLPLRSALAPGSVRPSA